MIDEEEYRVKGFDFLGNHDYIKKAVRAIWHLIINLINESFETRPMIQFLKEKNNLPLIGVEIGTLFGFNAYNICKNLPISRLYLVDPYLIYNGYRHREGWIASRIAKIDNPSEAIKRINMEAHSRLKQFSDKTVFIEKLSEEAIGDIPNNLDFVYIDGNHQYKYVKKDIELYYPKVIDGGIIGGHDFLRRGCIGVTKAVLEFADIHNLKLFSTEFDWWMIKND